MAKVTPTDQNLNIMKPSQAEKEINEVIQNEKTSN
jgi:hypothetical protein